MVPVRVWGQETGLACELACCLSRPGPGFRGQGRGAEGFGHTLSAFTELVPWGLVIAAEMIPSGCFVLPCKLFQNMKDCSE